MCANYHLNADPEELGRRFNVKTFRYLNYNYPSDIKPTNSAPIINSSLTHSYLSSRMANQLDSCRWGWRWQGKDKVHLVINTRVEKLTEKREFYKQVLTKDRCLIPTTGFIEHLGLGKNKQKTLFATGEIFAIGGYTHLGEIPPYAPAFSMITVRAENEMAGLHLGPLGDHRQPFLIPREMEEAWLDPKIGFDDVVAMIKSYPMGLKQIPQGQLKLL